MNSLHFRPTHDPAEVHRIGFLFPELVGQPLQASSFYFVGEATRPVARIVAAALCSPVSFEEGTFRWNVVPGHWSQETPSEFLRALKAEAAARGWKKLALADSAAEHPRTKSLYDSCGFTSQPGDFLYQCNPALWPRRADQLRQAHPGPELIFQEVNKAHVAEVWHFLEPFQIIHPMTFRQGIEAGAFREFSCAVWENQALAGLLLVAGQGDTMRAQLLALAVRECPRKKRALLLSALGRGGWQKLQQAGVGNLSVQIHPEKYPAAHRLLQRLGAKEVGRRWIYEVTL